MENNNYSENIVEKDLLSESEQIFAVEKISEKEEILVKKEENSSNIVASEDNDDETKKRREEKELQSESGSSSGASPGSTGAMATMAGAAAAGVTFVILIVTIIASITVNIFKLNVYGTYIDYGIKVELELKLDKDTVIDYDNLNTGLFLSIYNNKESYLVPLNAGDEKLVSTYEIKSKTDELVKIEYVFSGTVEGLKEGTRYNMEVFGDNNGSKKSYSNQTFKTIGKITKFNEVTVECHCQIDGKLYFQLDFVDENNYYSDFAYTLTKLGESTPSIIGKIETDLTAKKAIDVSGLMGKDYILTITFNSTAPSDSESSTKTIVTNIKL